MRRIVAAFFIALLLVAGTAQHSHALGLKVAPLNYKTTLKSGEMQQGFIDVSNPSGQTVNVTTSVQAFRQINDEGGLQFYDDKKIEGGIKNDLQKFELGPRQALRMYFVIDGNVLPEGDVYAAIFFTTEPTQSRNGVGQLVRIGTILSIINKTPGPREAAITGLHVPFIQLSDTIHGSYSVKNTGSEQTGFYPAVKVSASPGDNSKQIESSLVFGGRQRSNDFVYKTGYGIHLLEVGYGDSKRSQLVVTVSPFMIILSALIAVIIAIELILLKRRRKSRSKPASTSEK